MFEKIRNKSTAVLLWSQKYTRTDMIYLAKSAFWLNFGDIIASASAFVIALVFANFVPKDTFGTYKYVLSIVGILGLFSLTGMNVAVTRSVARGKEGILLPAVKSSVKWSSLATIVGVIISIYYFYTENQILGYSFLIVAAFLPLKDSFALYGDFLLGKRLFSIFSIYGMVSQIITSAILIAGVYFMPNLYIILVVYFTPKIMMQIYFFFKTIREYRPNDEREDGDLNFGKHLSLLGIFLSISEQLDKILLWHSLGPIQLATYSFAQAPAIQIKSFLGSILPIAFPKLAKNNPQSLKDTLPRKLLVVFFVLVPVVVIYILLAPYLYRLFFPRYMDSIFYSQIYILIILFFPRNFISDTLKAQAQKKKIYILSISNSVIKIILLLILVPRFGIVGAISALLGSELYNLSLSYFLFKRI